MADQSEQRKRAGQIVRRLKKAYPEAECALRHDDPFQLLCATILSAQCTDERVNIVTPLLFEKYPTPEKLAAARQTSVEKIIQSTGFFRNKAKNLIGMAKAVAGEHGGELPQDLDALVKLPGVGRKTANVVMGTAFGVPTGVVVDTHVTRISKLLGLTTGKSAEAIERDLMELLPKKEWINFSHRLIHHGRRICIARRPKCVECPLLAVCERAGLPDLGAE
ncbi:MAG: endonuclease III [Planctomycetota bacterium]|nr:MAG: endonuclease III [Planctomycetota bacterium]REK39680.1 MAG: endonuclease III [Planctomycetota bacterium]